MQEISLRRCGRVGDAGVAALAAGCALRRLRLHGCHALGAAAVLPLAGPRGCVTCLSYKLVIPRAFSQRQHGCHALGAAAVAGPRGCVAYNPSRVWSGSQGVEPWYVWVQRAEMEQKVTPRLACYLSIAVLYL